MIGNMMRFNPCHAWIREFVAGGNLGEVTEAQALFGYDLPAFFPLASSPWRLEPSLSGGGAMMDVGVHVVDLLRWLIGREVTEVTGAIDTRSHPFPIDWNSTAVLRFAGGALATVLASFDNRFRENYLSISGTPRQPEGRGHALAAVHRQRAGGDRPRPVQLSGAGRIARPLPAAGRALRRVHPGGPHPAGRRPRRGARPGGVPGGLRSGSGAQRSSSETDRSRAEAQRHLAIFSSCLTITVTITSRMIAMAQARPKWSEV